MTTHVLTTHWTLVVLLTTLYVVMSHTSGWACTLSHSTEDDDGDCDDRHSDASSAPLDAKCHRAAPAKPLGYNTTTCGDNSVNNATNATADAVVGCSSSAAGAQQMEMNPTVASNIQLSADHQMTSANEIETDNISAADELANNYEGASTAIRIWRRLSGSRCSSSCSARQVLCVQLQYSLSLRVKHLSPQHNRQLELQSEQSMVVVSHLQQQQDRLSAGKFQRTDDDVHGKEAIDRWMHQRRKFCSSQNSINCSSNSYSSSSNNSNSSSSSSFSISNANSFRCRSRPETFVVQLTCY